MRCCGSILIGGLEIFFPWGRFSEYFEVVSLEMYNEKVVLLLHRFFVSLPLSNQVRAKTTGQDKTQRDSPSYNSMNRRDGQCQHIRGAPQQAQPPRVLQLGGMSPITSTFISSSTASPNPNLHTACWRSHQQNVRSLSPWHFHRKTEINWLKTRDVLTNFHSSPSLLPSPAHPFTATPKPSRASSLNFLISPCSQLGTTFPTHSPCTPKRHFAWSPRSSHVNGKESNRISAFSASLVAFPSQGSPSRWAKRSQF